MLCSEADVCSRPHVLLPRLPRCVTIHKPGGLGLLMAEWAVGSGATAHVALLCRPWRRRAALLV